MASPRNRSNSRVLFGDQYQTETAGMRGDEQIVCTDQVRPDLQIGPDLSIVQRRFSRESSTAACRRKASTAKQS